MTLGVFAKEKEIRRKKKKNGFENESNPARRYGGEKKPGEKLLLHSNLTFLPPGHMIHIKACAAFNYTQLYTGTVLYFVLQKKTQALPIDAISKGTGKLPTSTPSCIVSLPTFLQTKE